MGGQFDARIRRNLLLLMAFALLLFATAIYERHLGRFVSGVRRGDLGGLGDDGGPGGGRADGTPPVALGLRLRHRARGGIPSGFDTGFGCTTGRGPAS